MATLFDSIELEQEDIVHGMKGLSATGDKCRVGLLHPFNRGLIARGNHLAKIAVVHEAPRDSETERGTAMIGSHGREFDRWLQLLGLDGRLDVFVTTIVQCQPPKEDLNGQMTQRKPDPVEVSSCFGPRCLRILRAMPHLEVVMALGWPVAQAFLGGDPKAKTHDGQWFESSLLPGKAIFCMADPVWVVRDPSPEKSMSVERTLTLFQREYLKERWVVDLAADAKTQREAQGIGLL